MDNAGFTINPKLYDFLKWVALTVLPAAVVLISGLGLLLKWDDAAAVAGVVALVDTFLGALLSRSSKNFAKEHVLGDLIISQDRDGVPNGMRIIGVQENPVFQDGSQVKLNVKREQPLK